MNGLERTMTMGDVRLYPQLSAEAVRAAVAYAAKGMKNEVVWDVKIPA